LGFQPVFSELENAAAVPHLDHKTVEPISRGHLLEVPRFSLPDAATESMLDGLAGLHSFVLAVDSNLRVTWLNDDLGIVSGGADESIGRPAASLLDELWPSDASAFHEQTQRFISQMLEDNRVSGARFDLRQDGTALSVEVSAFVVQDSTKKELFICVADRHSTRESLEQKNEELENYVRSVSHDLRSPLVSMLGFSRFLRDDYREALDETGLHFLDRIEQAGRNMEQLLHDMRELSRIEETPHCRVHVHPAPILEQLHSELKIQLDEKNIELRLPANPPTVLCDRTRLYQLLSNLIGNSIQHMQAGTQGRVEVEIETVLDGWQISVSDTGPGIAPKDRDRIFEAFQTAGRCSDPNKSSGLGLAIVKKIVDAHSGRIWIEGGPESGARFSVWLPKG
jgi:signal transduction histidine kinase